MARRKPSHSLEKMLAPVEKVLDMSDYTRQRLQKQGIEYLGQLLLLKPEELRQLTEMGVIPVRRIEDSLKKMGLRLGVFSDCFQNVLLPKKNLILDFEGKRKLREALKKTYGPQEDHYVTLDIAVLFKEAGISTKNISPAFLAATVHEIANDEKFKKGVGKHIISQLRKRDIR